MLHQGFSRASFDRASEIASVTRRVARVFRGRALPFLDGAAVFCSARLYESAGVTSVLITPSLSISVSEVDLLT